MASTGNISIVAGVAPAGLIPSNSARATLGGLVRQILTLTTGKLSVFIGLKSRRVIAFSGVPDGEDAILAGLFVTSGLNWLSQIGSGSRGFQLTADTVQTTVKGYTMAGVTITSSLAGAPVVADNQPFIDYTLKPVLRSFSLQGLIDTLDDAHSVALETDPDGWGGADMAGLTETLIYLGQDDNRISVGNVSAPNAQALMDDIAAKDAAYGIFGVGGALETSVLLVDALSTVAAPTSSDEFFEPGGVI